MRKNSKYFCNYSEGSIPRGVFCERSSQKARECRREIMQSMISVHREACNCEGTEQLRLFYITILKELIQHEKAYRQRIYL